MTNLPPTAACWPWLEITREMTGPQFDCHICGEPSAIRVVYAAQPGQTAVQFLCAEHRNA